MNAPATPLMTLHRLIPSAPPEDAPAVGYVIMGFPRLSETFIAHEIHLLESLGLRLRLFSVKQEHEPKSHPVVRAIRARCDYLPKTTSLSGTALPRWLGENLPRFAGAHRRVLARHPLRYLGTLASALAMSWRYRKGRFSLRKVFIKEFLQAGTIADAVLREPDIAHLHGHFCHGVATITWFASRMTGRPFSFTAHAKDIYQADLNPGDLLERKLGAARFVATCTAANAAVLRGRAPDPQRVHTIYHGLDTDFFAPTPRPGPPVPLILSVGRFVHKKGFSHLIDACAALKRRGIRFGCVIVGEPGEAGDAMAEQIQRLNLAGCVQLRGAVTQDALREIYRDARVFALPCQVMADGDRDGIPNVLVEAMAMGVPVVSTAISGIPELIEDSNHGLLVPPGDAPALAAALERVLTDAALHARLVAAARARVCATFDSRRTTLALRDLFLAQLPPGAPVAASARRAA